MSKNSADIAIVNDNINFQKQSIDIDTLIRGCRKLYNQKLILDKATIM